MIEINLLPPELRKKKTIHPADARQIFSLKTILVFLGYFALAHTVLLTVSFISAKRLDGIKASWNKSASQRTTIARLNNEYADISQKVLLIEKLIGERILWAKKLNLLSGLLVDGVWLNQLSIDARIAARIESKKENPVKKEKNAKKEKPAKEEKLAYICLTIRGSAASRTKDEPALIGQFIQNLKDSPEFAGDFMEIELGPITQRQITQTTVMDFALTAQFTPEKTSALSQ